MQIIYSPDIHTKGVPDTTTGLPSGDDRIVSQFASGTDYIFGYFSGHPGMVFNTYTSTYDTAADSNPQIYVRVWDGPSISSSTHYNDTVLIVPQTGPNPINVNDPNAYPINLSTTVGFVLVTPNITSVSPVAGTTGNSVTILGSNFGASGTVGFQLLTGGTTYPATNVINWSAGSITVAVPAAPGKFRSSH